MEMIALILSFNRKSYNVAYELPSNPPTPLLVVHSNLMFVLMPKSFHFFILHPNHTAYPPLLLSPLPPYTK
jgi:hypothetical protein